MHPKGKSRGHRNHHSQGKMGHIRKEEKPKDDIKFTVNTTPHFFDSGVNGPKGSSMNIISGELEREREYNKIMCRKTPRSVEAFFLGPRGENTDYFRRLVEQAIYSHHTARIDYEHEDYRHTRKTMKQEPSFLDAQDSM